MSFIECWSPDGTTIARVDRPIALYSVSRISLFVAQLVQASSFEKVVKRVADDLDGEICKF